MDQISLRATEAAPCPQRGLTLSQGRWPHKHKGHDCNNNSQASHPEPPGAKSFTWFFPPLLLLIFRKTPMRHPLPTVVPPGKVPKPNNTASKGTR